MFASSHIPRRALFLPSEEETEAQPLQRLCLRSALVNSRSPSLVKLQSPRSLKAPKLVFGKQAVTELQHHHLPDGRF